MRQLMMFQVDAFATSVFQGNPAAVLILDDWLPEQTMLAIANENNLSETAFACREGEGWRLRWWTPVQEVDFCGHATLATAHVLATEFHAGPTVAFLTRVGEIRVCRDGSLYRLDLPAFWPEPVAMDDPLLDGITGGAVVPVAAFRNFENIFLELEAEDAVTDLVPDLGKIASLAPLGCAITARSARGSYDFVSRYFAPGAGIPEDPVTGSIHATLAPYWSLKLKKLELKARQCSSRGGILTCRVADNRCFISGSAVTFMKAQIFIPDQQ